MVDAGSLAGKPPEIEAHAAREELQLVTLEPAHLSLLKSAQMLELQTAR
jgi:hypothetical protein